MKLTVDPDDAARYSKDAIYRVYELAPGEWINWADAVNATKLMHELDVEIGDDGGGA